MEITNGGRKMFNAFKYKLLIYYLMSSFFIFLFSPFYLLTFALCCILLG